jgi:hypothetical protein
VTGSVPAGFCGEVEVFSKSAKERATAIPELYAIFARLVYAVQVGAPADKYATSPSTIAGPVNDTLPQEKLVVVVEPLPASVKRLMVPAVAEYSAAAIAAIGAVPVLHVAVIVSVPPVVITL